MTLFILFCFLFWLALGLLFYTFLGYPCLIYFLGRFFPRRAAAQSFTPFITVVLAAHNEEQRISARLQNLLASDYPDDKLEVAVVADGCTDATEDRVRALGDARVRLLAQTERSGKAKCLNVGVPFARGELVVFADVRQRFAPDTIARLAAHFCDARIGAVSGSLMIDPAVSGTGMGVDAYWRLEKFLRFYESEWDSCIGCTGAVYTIRAALFEAFPADTLLDDVVIPMNIATRGHRIKFDPAALAYDAQSLEPERERVRKQRTLAGNFQMLFRHPAWLLPWRNRLWWELISHKYLRLAAPWILAVFFISNALLIHEPFYRCLFAGQCVFYALAVVGAMSPLKNAPFSLPAGFVFLNLMALSGLRHYLRGTYQQGKMAAPRLSPAVDR